MQMQQSASTCSQGKSTLTLFCFSFPSVELCQFKHLKVHLGPPWMTKNLCLGRKMITFSSCVMKVIWDLPWMTKNVCLGPKLIFFSSCVMTGEHEVSWENMEIINQITKNTLKMIQSTRFLTQKKTLFGHQKAQNTLFYVFYVAGRKNHKIHTGRTWSWVSSKWENIKRNVEPSYSHHTMINMQKYHHRKVNNFWSHFFCVSPIIINMVHCSVLLF